MKLTIAIMSALLAGAVTAQDRGTGVYQAYPGPAGAASSNLAYSASTNAEAARVLAAAANNLITNRPMWKTYVGTAVDMPSGDTVVMGFNTIIRTNRVSYTTATGRAAPTVAGWYWTVANAQIASGADALDRAGNLYIRKNGNTEATIPFFSTATIVRTYRPQITALVYCNGTSDYVDVAALQAFQVEGTNTVATNMFFSGIFAGQ